VRRSRIRAGKLNALRDVFTDLVRDLDNAESQLIKARPKMPEASNSQQLRETPDWNDWDSPARRGLESPLAQ
jgi:hypothetical protein